jgi:hypothetical protein
VTELNAHKYFVEHGDTIDEKEFDSLSCFLCRERNFASVTENGLDC